MLNQVRKEMTGVYHKHEYTTAVDFFENKLVIEVKDELSGFVWKNEFSDTHIELITQEAGSMKKFDIFVKMLNSAFEDSYDAVFLNILTYKDVESLRSIKAKNDHPSDSKKLHDRLYVILTHTVDSLKVSYPLPLLREEGKEGEVRRAILNDARAKNGKTRDDSPAANYGFLDARVFTNMKQENLILKEKCKILEESLTMLTTKDRDFGINEVDIFLKSKLEVKILILGCVFLQSSLEKLTREYSREIKNLKEIIEDLQKELLDAKDELKRAPEPNKRSANNRRSKLIQNEEDEVGLSMSKGIISHHKREIDELKQEIEELKSLDIKHKNRIKQLEKELANALKSIVKSQTTALFKRSPSQLFKQETDASVVVPEPTKRTQNSFGQPIWNNSSTIYDKDQFSPKFSRKSARKNFPESPINSSVGTPRKSPYHRDQNGLSMFAKNMHKAPIPSFSEHTQLLNAHQMRLSATNSSRKRRTLSEAIVELREKDQLTQNEDVLVASKPKPVKINLDMTPNIIKITKRANSSRALFQTRSLLKDQTPKKTKMEVSNLNFAQKSLKTPKHHLREENSLQKSDSENSIDFQDIDKLIKNFT